MLTRHAIRVVVALGATLLPASGSGEARAGGDERPAPAPSKDEQAIREIDRAFVRDYDKGDSKALSALFTEDAEVIEADGRRFRGRAEVEQEFADGFAASPGCKIALEIDSIRFLGADVAKEEGRSTVTPTRGAPVSREYTVLWVRRDGRWLVDSVSESPSPLVRPRERLKDLEWLVGDWVDEGSDAEVRVHCGWSGDENFLLRSFTVKRQGKPVMTVSQRIGWDPIAKQFRSWEFDSEGGFSEGRWSRAGSDWVIKHTGVRPEGATASVTTILSPRRPDLVDWAAVDRVIGDESLPDEEGFALVRVPPAPASGPKPPATPETTPNQPRNPR